MLLEVAVLTPKEAIFEGKARSVILPGENGVFEILPFHKGIVARLISGNLFIDGEKIPIRRGVVKVYKNQITVIVEEP
jgi:F0F1-type ATP synthase epsilon subunit